MSEQADVIVIGGGIMGTSTAFFLRRRKRSVIVLERGLTGQQASGVNFGGIRRQGRALPQLAMANRALETWRRSKELLNEDVEFLPSSHTRVCYHAHDADTFDRYAADARAYGLELEVLHGQAMFERFPFLGREVLAASISPLDGHANPRLASPAFARAALRLGARIVENTEIVRVEKDGEGFRVESAAGDVYRAAQLVICAGAWASALTQQFGEPVPLRASGPQMSVTEAGAVCVQVVDGRVHIDQAGGHLLPPDSARQHHPGRRPAGSRRCRHAPRLRLAAEHRPPDRAVPPARSRAVAAERDPGVERRRRLSAGLGTRDRPEFESGRALLRVRLQRLGVSDRAGRRRDARRTRRYRPHADTARRLLHQAFRGSAAACSTSQAFSSWCPRCATGRCPDRCPRVHRSAFR